jgi:hypothetical protein
MADEKRNNGAILWTSLIIAVTSVIFWNLFHRVLFIKAIYRAGGAFFTATQPGFFPIIYLIAVIVSSWFSVWIYQSIISLLPGNWILRGIVIGGVLFLIIDLPYLIQTAFTTVLPVSAAQSMGLAALLTRLVNGVILTYTYAKFTPDTEESGVK